MIYLQQWMDWAGIGTRDMARRIKISPAAITMMTRRRSRPRWLFDAAQEIGIDPAMLAVHPADEAARPVRGKVLFREARRRLRAAALSGSARTGAAKAPAAVAAPAPAL